MKRKWLLGILIGLIVGIPVGYGISASSQPKPAQTVQNAPTVAQLLTLVNAERAKNGVAPLKEDPRLDASAQLKSADEQSYSYFGHVSPQGSPYVGMQGYHLIESTGLKCTYESENLTENSIVNDAPHAVNAWIKSPAHHAAMIDAKYSLTGFGISGDEIVEHFCQTP